MADKYEASKQWLERMLASNLITCADAIKTALECVDDMIERRKDFYYAFTKKGQKEAEAYCKSAALKRKEILDASKDTAEETILPTPEDIISDVNLQGLDYDDEYINNFGVTDNYDAGPILLKYGEDIIEVDPYQEWKNKQEVA